MAYADYTYYSGTYMGTVSEEDFPRLAVRASSYLDYYTRDKAKDNAELDAVKMCCCALVDVYKLIETAKELANKDMTAGLSSDAIQSETVGGYSRTMRSGGEGASSSLQAGLDAKKQLAATAMEYLASTGLLYRGGC
nr:MAG TPA: Head Tail Connector Protein [Caudoviricetes sp.]